MICYSNELYHHGILGQRWGVRRFQNKDGTLTTEGKKRNEPSDSKKASNRIKKVLTTAAISAGAIYASLKLHEKVAPYFIAYGLHPVDIGRHWISNNFGNNDAKIVDLYEQE